MPGKNQSLEIMLGIRPSNLSTPQSQTPQAAPAPTAAPSQAVDISKELPYAQDAILLAAKLLKDGKSMAATVEQVRKAFPPMRLREGNRLSLLGLKLVGK